MLIDTHSHLYDEAFDDDRSKVIERARQADVMVQILPNVNAASFQKMICVLNQMPDCVPMIGLHPTEVNQQYPSQINFIKGILNETRNMTKTKMLYGIGEIGIDLYHSKEFANEQIEVFRTQVQLAKEYGLPISIHVRNAFDEVFAVLDKEMSDDLSGVFHCFSGTVADYQHILEYKTFMVGLGGTLTYKNSEVAKFANQLDLNKIVLETDCPYLAPEPVRGKRNEPFNVLYVAGKLAKLRNMHINEVATLTTDNAIRLFKLPITKN